MRLKIYFVLLFLCVLKVYGQNINLRIPNDSTVTFGEIKSYSYIGKEFSNYSSYYDKRIEQNYIVPIIGAHNGSLDRKSFEIIYKGKNFFVDSKSIDVHPQAFDALIQMDSVQIIIYRDLVFKNFIYPELLNQLNALEWIKKTGSHGIAILKRQVYDESEYTEGTGIKFEFINTSPKTIKYITFNFTGYNAVDDAVSTMKTRKGIGPIDTEMNGSYEFEYVWHTDIVEYARLNSIKIQYMDNTIKTLSSSVLSKLFVSDEHKEILDIED